MRAVVILALASCTAFSAALAAALPSAAGEALPERSILVSEASNLDSKANRKAPRRFSGNVSWYGPKFHGKKTASGEIFDMNKLTAAHRTLPFGTRLMVENPKTGQSVVVKVNDRGPYAHRRVLDMSREAARRAGILLGGVAFMNLTILDQPYNEN